MALTLLGDPSFAQLFGLGSDDFFPGCSTHDESGRKERNTRPILTDVYETDKEFIVKADIPGVKKDQIKVTVNEDVLTISVEPSKEEQKEDQQAQQQQGSQQQQGQKEGGHLIVHRKERSTRFARRRVRMPLTAQLNKIQAKYENGVLELHIPKDEEKVKARTIPVE